jgi:hypothetical protein
MANETSTNENNEAELVERTQHLLVLRQLEAVEAQVLQTPFHELATRLPVLLQEWKTIAAGYGAGDVSMLSTTNVVSRLAFAHDVLKKIEALKTLIATPRWSLRSNLFWMHSSSSR